jgi:hypothetical protein
MPKQQSLLSELPEYISADSWEGFCEMRKIKFPKRPFTARAQRMVIKRLIEMFQDQYEDPNMCLDQSTFFGWDTVYPVGTKFRQMMPKAYDAQEFSRPN